MSLEPDVRQLPPSRTARREVAGPDQRRDDVIGDRILTPDG